MKAKLLPDLKYLNECFELDAACPSGLRWRVRPHSHFETKRGWNMRNSKDAGKSAGSFWSREDAPDYYLVGMANKVYLAHRVVYAMYYGSILDVDIEIDHRDGNGTNNLIDNLRLATSTKNSYNRKSRNDNTSGHKGLSYRKDLGIWRGRVMHEGKNYLAGCSPAKEVVIELIRELREKLHKEFHNHG